MSVELLRQLPSVDRLMAMPGALELATRYGKELATEAVRRALDAQRHQLLNGDAQIASADAILDAAETWLAQLMMPTLRPVINATGVIIHTNLGRAPLSDAALQAIRDTASGYSTLEYDLAAGQRGTRSVHAERLLTRLTGAEAAFVVNNNAAAVLLMLSALCAGREVVISRGQLVEIGGGFRVPEVMAQSGCRLVEVGTTNRTHLRDYEAAISEDTAAILVAHHSNYKIVGFTSEPGLRELAALANARGIALLFDQGSGALLDTSVAGLESEPMVQAALADGADLVAFSGDKLLGGPQAGIVVGKSALVERCRKHPLARAVRPDKLCLAALSATLGLYLTGALQENVPVWRMLNRSAESLFAEAEAWAAALRKHGVRASIAPGESTVGGGSLPGNTLPTFLVAVETAQPDALAAALRRYDPPVIARIVADTVVLDPRTVLPSQRDAVLAAVASLAGSQGHYR